MHCPKPHTTKSTFLEIGFTCVRRNAISYKPPWSSLLPTEFVFTHSLLTDNWVSVALELPQIRNALCFLCLALFFCSSGELQPHSQKQCLVCQQRALRQNIRCTWVHCFLLFMCLEKMPQFCTYDWLRAWENCTEDLSLHDLVPNSNYAPLQSKTKQSCLYQPHPHSSARPIMDFASLLFH